LISLAEYFASVKNGRQNGKQITVGGRSSVTEAHIRGWDAGVKVMPVKGKRNVLSIYMTGGSNGATKDQQIGTVILNDDRVPEFIPWPNPLPH
jgi:hypothetical protein